MLHFSASLNNIRLNVSVPFSVSLEASSGTQLSADDLAAIGDHVSISLSNDQPDGPSVGLSGDVVCSVLGINVDWHVTLTMKVNADDGTVITPTVDNAGSRSRTSLVSSRSSTSPGNKPATPRKLRPSWPATS